VVKTALVYLCERETHVSTPFLFQGGPWLLAVPRNAVSCAVHGQRWAEPWVAEPPEQGAPAAGDEGGREVWKEGVNCLPIWRPVL